MAFVKESEASFVFHEVVFVEVVATDLEISKSCSSDPFCRQLGVSLGAIIIQTLGNPGASCH